MSTVEGWCNVLGLNPDIYCQTVDAHLRAISPLHSEMVDFVQQDSERAEPGCIFGRGRA